MAAELRILRQRVRSVQSIKQITRAYELIATSRIGKARAKVAAALPYAQEMTKVLTALSTAATNLDHPLLTPRENPRRAAVLAITSDKGMCGGYNSNLLRQAEELQQLLRDEGKEVKLYVVGRKGITYYRFRNREIAGEWSGFSEQPTYASASEMGDQLVDTFMDENNPERPDELHMVYTEFQSMLTQRPVAKRIAPLDVEYTDGTPEQLPDYEFEPEAEELLGSLLPKYVKTRLFAALLEAAVSESAYRQRAMKSATDNANELIRTYTRQMNSARQAQITQEISEIVGGADALAAAGSEE
ncbi:MAG TPA: F0F1 ATP synthase subunit gamma [Pseudonocardiaceae bacterium]|jgi:F-type H+-transporting ATPase subunit gamma